MIVLKMELWPFGIERLKRTIAEAKIVNDGTGDDTIGNYDVELRHKSRLFRKCRVEGFPRQRLTAWDILCRALNTAIGKRNPIAKDTEPA